MYGLFAYETARQLCMSGREVAFLALFDTFLWTAARGCHSPVSRAAAHLLGLAQNAVALHMRAVTAHLRELRRIGAAFAPDGIRDSRRPDGSEMQELTAVLRQAA